MPFPSQNASDASNISSTPNSGNPERSKPVIPPWVPVSLLVVTTAALAVPLVLIRRQRAAASVSNAAKSSTSTPPPRRTAGSFIITKFTSMPSNTPTLPTIRSQPSSSSPSAPPPRRLVRLPPASVASTAASATVPSPVAESPLVSDPTDFEDREVGSERELEYDGFNAPLYTLKAFSIASLVVLTGGVAGVWSVKTYMGVKDTEEFASRMRQSILTYMPVLTSRIHRAPEVSDDRIAAPPFPLPTSLFPNPSDSSEPQSPSPVPQYTISTVNLAEPWTWSAAQQRLSDAYDRGGLQEWMEAAALEMEIERETEVRRRAMMSGQERGGV